MLLIIIFVAFSVFIFGLFQWAKGGATLWRIRDIRRRQRSGELSEEERRQAVKDIRSLEKGADKAISGSFKFIGALAVFTWVFLGVTMLLDLLGINWVSALSGRAARYWNANASTSVYGSSITAERNDMLKNLGSSLK